MRIEAENQQLIDITQPVVFGPEEAPTSSLAGSIFSTGSQIILGTMGICAGILYLNPGKVCAERVSCGLWLSKLITEKRSDKAFTLRVELITDQSMPFGPVKVFLG